MRYERAIKHILWPLRQRAVHYALGALAIICLLTVLAQLTYPENRTLPFVKLHGLDVGGLSDDDLVEHLRENYDNASLRIDAGGRMIEVPLGMAGLRVDYSKVIRDISYGTDKRLVPFSWVPKAAMGDIRIPVAADSERLDSFVAEVQALCRLEPENAGLTLKDGELAATPSKEGVECPEAEIRKALTSVVVEPVVKVKLHTVPVMPQRSDEDIRPLFEQVSRLIDQPFFFSVINERQEVPKEILTSWFTFGEDSDGRIIVVFDDAKIDGYLRERERSVYIAPGITTISLNDGTETGRVTGKSGQGLDIETTRARIKNVILGQEEGDTAYAALKVLPPTVRYSYSYSKTQRGLDALLADIVREKGNYGIAVKVLSGKYTDLGGHANGSRSYITASTYKLFVAYGVLKDIEAGKFTWSDSISGGRNAEQCFDDMIIKSDNPCAVAFGNKVGWSNITAQMHALGMSSTFLKKSPTNDNYSTALDEALFLTKLENGELLQGENRTRLMNAMKAQIYRKGIPAGVKGTVADKVGFLYGLLHDAAIVYGPDNTYVIVIMSDGSSWTSIADAAKRIDAFLSQ